MGVSTFPVSAGFCSADDSFVWAFAVNTWERQSHSVVPGYFWWDLDTNQDDVLDFAVYNFDLSLSSVLSDGRTVTWAEDLTSGKATAAFFTEHAIVTENTVLYICAEQIGLTSANMLATNVDVFVYAIDNYFTGNVTDVMGPFTITPLGERYFGIPGDIADKSTGSMTVVDYGLFPGNTPELGVMLFTNGERGARRRYIRH